MHHRHYPFDRNGPNRLELTWKSRFEDTRVLLDGKIVHTFFDWNDVLKGATIPLEDGSSLFVRARGLMGIEVRRDGLALPGSDMDPTFSLGVSAQWMFWLAGAALAIEVERLIRVDAPVVRTFTALQALGDVVFLGLAFLVKRGKRWALGVAVVMMLVSAVLSWTMGRGFVASGLTTVMFALLAARFAATGEPERITISQPPLDPPRRKRNPLGWPSRADDE